MKIKLNILFLLMIVMVCLPASAQSGMEEYFYESGKIKIVVGVASIVMVGLLLYLWRLDNRISNIEKTRKGGKS